MELDSDTGVPANIAAAWGLRERPAKGPKPGLTLDGIVQAGIRVAAADGIGAVSMSRVAAEAGRPPWRSTVTSGPRTSCSR
ncbi:hypothetical protein ACFQZ4_29260 [Catellatospora coxensis]